MAAATVTDIAKPISRGVVTSNCERRRRLNVGFVSPFTIHKSTVASLRRVVGAYALDDVGADGVDIRIYRVASFAPSYLSCFAVDRIGICIFIAPCIKSLKEKHDLSYPVRYGDEICRLSFVSHTKGDMSTLEQLSDQGASSSKGVTRGI